MSNEVGNNSLQQIPRDNITEVILNKTFDVLFYEDFSFDIMFDPSMLWMEIVYCDNMQFKAWKYWFGMIDMRKELI